MKWIVTVGAIFALCTNLLGAMFPLPRILYAMSSDGMLYEFFQRINERTKTPLLATILSGFLSAFLAMIFDLHQLIEMMSIGTLMAYTIVSICVLVLRYQSDDQPLMRLIGENKDSPMPPQSYSWSRIAGQLFNCNGGGGDKHQQATNLSSNVVKVAIVIYSLAAIFFGLLLKEIQVNGFTDVLTTFLSIFGVLMVVLMVMIARQPMLPNEALTFKVPFVPWLPCLSVAINLYLMFQLDILTWMRMGVWASIGMCPIVFIIKSI